MKKTFRIFQAFLMLQFFILLSAGCSLIMGNCGENGPLYFNYSHLYSKNTNTTLHFTDTSFDTSFTADTIPADQFTLQLFLTIAEESQYAGITSPYKAAYACSPVQQLEFKAEKLEIFNLTDLSAEYPAGSLMNEHLTAVHPASEQNTLLSFEELIERINGEKGGGLEAYVQFKQLPLANQNYQFNIRTTFENGEVLSDTTDIVFIQ